MILREHHGELLTTLNQQNYDHCIQGRGGRGDINTSCPSACQGMLGLLSHTVNDYDACERSTPMASSMHWQREQKSGRTAGHITAMSEGMRIHRSAILRRFSGCHHSAQLQVCLQHREKKENKQYDIWYL
ncbi:hypothetical protein BaRGS_00010939 [Batillaria attramentaria]|uniref:Uncharacterized protein n=1 Tax=Batillaria attramentaria TaxID=370345 RepID=A0ABD0LEL1_9CAEN